MPIEEGVVLFHTFRGPVGKSFYIFPVSKQVWSLHNKDQDMPPITCRQIGVRSIQTTFIFSIKHLAVTDVTNYQVKEIVVLCFLRHKAPSTMMNWSKVFTTSQDKIVLKSRKATSSALRQIGSRTHSHATKNGMLLFLPQCGILWVAKLWPWIDGF